MKSHRPRRARTLGWAWLLCLLSSVVMAGWEEAMPGARLLGSGELRLIGFRVYDAKLWSPAQPFEVISPFALELTYRRAITRDDLVEASLAEIRRLSPQVDAARLARWRAEMERAFVDVQPGDSITGVYLPGRGARFYVGPNLRHTVRDDDFARAFFAIWLDPRTRNPRLRAQLLGEPRR